MEGTIEKWFGKTIKTWGWRIARVSGRFDFTRMDKISRGV